jgi:hypothetical protein
MAYISTSPGLFVVLGQTNTPVIDEAIRTHFPNESYALHPGQWLISAPGKTTKEISDQLGISMHPFIGSAIIMSVGNYFGVAAPQIWEWIGAKVGALRV